MSLNLTWYLVVSAIIFTIGVTGVLIRRNPLIIFMSIELMLNAVNLSFIAFSHYLNSVDGQMFVFLVLTVAAAEVVVGLAIIVSVENTVVREVIAEVGPFQIAGVEDRLTAGLEEE